MNRPGLAHQPWVSIDPRLAAVPRSPQGWFTFVHVREAPGAGDAIRSGALVVCPSCTATAKIERRGILRARHLASCDLRRVPTSRGPRSVVPTVNYGSPASVDRAAAVAYERALSLLDGDGTVVPPLVSMGPLYDYPTASLAVYCTVREDLLPGGPLVHEFLIRRVAEAPRHGRWLIRPTMAGLPREIRLLDFLRLVAAERIVARESSLELRRAPTDRLSALEALDSSAAAAVMPVVNVFPRRQPLG